MPRMFGMARIVPETKIEDLGTNSQGLDMVESLSQSGNNEGRCATHEFMDHVDAHMEDVANNLSIFTLIWAARRINCTVIATLVFAMFGQVFVPTFVFVKGLQASPWQEESKLDDSSDSYLIRVASIVMTAYLWSTLYGTISRCRGMVYLIQVVPEWTWVLGLGIVTLHLSLIATGCATFLLYIQSPDVQNILLNCVALNFIPDMDTALVVHVVAADLQLSNGAKRRLEKLADAWPRSQQRAQLESWHRFSILQRFRMRPVLSLQLVEMSFYSAFAAIALVLTPVFL
mmetsp:Transcript_81831/g.162451  ORF Transcript_81831/g.162451 Transcript_81831/m.162451 type:complete len:287 (+) Transcript_81831:39-899(+)